MNTLTACRRKLNDRRGFSLAEVLLAVGILIILLALLIPNLVKTRKELRQKELDAKAEILYVAAQNQLAKLRAGGNAGLYANLSGHNVIPVDAQSGEDRAFCYITSDDPLAASIMGPGSADASLLSHGWIIEFEPKSGTVYAVYYTEATDVSLGTYPSDAWQLLRSRSARLDGGAKVGYYGGEIEETSSGDTFLLRPEIVCEADDERLTLKLYCETKNIRDELIYSLKINGIDIPSTNLAMSKVGYRRSNNLNPIVLDDLFSDDTRIGTKYSAKPGADLTIEFTVTSTNPQLQGKTETKTVNSLFSRVEDGVAYITCVRHLQNLECITDASGITAAVLENDLDLDAGNWKKLYNNKENQSNGYFNGNDGNGNPIFRPISVSALKHFDGNGKTVTGLVLGKDAAGNCGLFGSFTGSDAPTEPAAGVKNLTLAGTKTASATGVKNAGALAGTVSGFCKIENCSVILRGEDCQTIRDAVAGGTWVNMIGGENAGGLVGASSGTLTVLKSFAATTLSGTTNAGGLVGRVAGGTLTAQTAYADCYISGANVGGLVGPGAGVSITNCYAAGFLSGTNISAGLAAGQASMTRCYTVCDLGSPATRYGTAGTGSTAGENVYYLSAGSENIAGGDDANPGGLILDKDALTSRLGGAFAEVVTDGTTRYNLRVRLYRDYPYPVLRELGSKHTGDWKAEFQSGRLGYFEEYRDAAGRTLWGFDAEGVKSSLRSDLTLRGDGYCVVLTESGTVSVEINGGAAVRLDNYHTVKVDGVDYYIYPLGRDALNAEPGDGTHFWQKIRITTAGASGTQTYFFNPHLAMVMFGPVADTEEAPAQTPAVPGALEMRSPRQLYAMSLYYAEHWHRYWAVTPCAVTQARDIRYADYDWPNYGKGAERGERPYEQSPIGTLTNYFACAYNGACRRISGISIAGDGSAVGLFGATGGYVSNIVLSAEVSEGLYVKRSRDLGANETVYMGVLVGCNYGTVDNCAVSGYALRGSGNTIRLGQNSTLMLGGLVGRNVAGRTVKNCSVVFPETDVMANYASAYLGGFVGRNDGAVQNCYAIGHFNADKREGTVIAAGFAGANAGSIGASYCAVSMITSRDAKSFGFAPKGGQVGADCFYLSDGTYYYQGKLHSYGAESAGVAGKSYQAMETQRWTGPVNQTNSSNHGWTERSSRNYPFRGVVRNASMAYVHYGDWQTPPQLGTYGAFYWEHEEGGSNAGYHFSFLGMDEGVKKSGSTLCTAHDDGGRITEYGYGYYVLAKDDGKVTPTWNGIEHSEQTNSAWKGKNEKNLTTLQKARKGLEEQMEGYTFYPWLSGYATEGDYLYIDGSETAGTLLLKFGENQPSTFTLSPFFADAIEFGDQTAWRGNPNAPGCSENTAYEIRSVQQLRCINWNSVTHNCDTLVTGTLDDALEEGRTAGEVEESNRKQFPYLQYATGVGNGKQTKADATANRPVQYWLQTHDLNGAGFDRYTPIAGKATSSRSGQGTNIDADRPAPLFAWFGGSYDGQSYKIQNLDIISDSFTVGVFGVTVGATIKNIILYGDGTCGAGTSSAGTPAPVVQRVTNTGTVGDKVGAYQIGGLVALAYDYAGSDASSTISNCAISGYVIDDSSHNQHGLGYASVGGLFGVSQVELDRCSAVADIRINYHSPKENGDYRLVYSRYGNMIRVGGLAGTALDRVSNCYTGGSVEIDSNTLNETPWDVSVKNKVAVRDRSLQIFVGGIAGSVYKYGIVNFTGGSVTSDGSVNVSNCYTYLTLPRMEGNVYAASIIVGPADRFHAGTSLNASNCYYLGDRVLANYDESFEYTRDYTFKSGETGNLNGEEVDQILFGDLDCLPKVLFANTKELDHSSPAKEQQTALTYEQLSGTEAIAGGKMPGALGSAWHGVSITENGSPVPGKYSFSDNPAQAGKNYPFPTVIRQGEDISVHYGAWPINGAYWTKGRAGIDIFADMQSGDAPYAEKAFLLKLPEAMPISEPLTEWTQTGENWTMAGQTLGFATSPEGYAEIVSVENGETDRILSVTLRALQPGAVDLTETSTGATCTVTVTAELTVTAEPDTIRMPENGGGAEFTCTAKSGDRDFTGVDTIAEGSPWSAVPEKDEDGNALFSVDPNALVPNEFTVSGASPGDSFVTVTYAYDYHGVPLTASATVPVRTLGYIGLASGANGVTVNRTVQAPPQAAFAADGEQHPVFSAPQGADVFLFSPAGESDLQDFTIRTIAVRGASDAEETVVYSADPGIPAATDAAYSVYFFTADGGVNDKDKGPGNNTHPEVASDKNYNYYGATVRTAGSTQKVTVTVTLADPSVKQTQTVGEDTVETPEVYTLTLDDVTAYRYEVRFHADENAEGAQMRPLGIAAGRTLPPCSYEKTGYRFDGWGVDADGIIEPQYADGDALSAGETGTPDHDLDLFAMWSPVTYEVAFHANNGSDAETATRTFTYDATTLPNPAELGFEAADRFTRFIGWNTMQNGEGAWYDETDKNLTSEAGKTIDLYAQWERGYRLTLARLKQEANGTSFRVTGEDAALDGYDQADYTQQGWTLVGWYATDVPVLDGEGNPVTDGEGNPTYTTAKVLNDDGSIAGTVPGYTADGWFALTQERTLYAFWRCNAQTFTLVSELTGRDAANGTYLIASGADGTVFLLANMDTAKTWTPIPSPTADVHSGSAADENGNALGDAQYIGFDAVPAGVRWKAQYVEPITRAYSHGRTVDRYLLFNEKDLSLRNDNKEALQMRVYWNNGNPWVNDGGAFWKGILNNRNLWAYGNFDFGGETGVRSGVLMSEFAEEDTGNTTSHLYSLGYNTANSKWEILNGGCCYLYKPQVIYSFEPF